MGFFKAKPPLSMSLSHHGPNMFWSILHMTSETHSWDVSVGSVPGGIYLLQLKTIIGMLLAQLLLLLLPVHVADHFEVAGDLLSAAFLSIKIYNGSSFH